MRWLFAVTAFVSLNLCGASAAQAEDPEPVMVAEDEPAPFTGMLVPLHTSAVLTAKAEFCDEQIEKARKEEQEIAELSVKLVQGMRLNDKQAFDLKLQVMQDALSEVQPGWWEHPILWYGAGIVSAILVVWGSVEVYKAIAPELQLVAQ